MSCVILLSKSTYRISWATYLTNACFNFKDSVLATAPNFTPWAGTTREGGKKWQYVIYVCMFVCTVYVSEILNGCCDLTAQDNAENESQQCLEESGLFILLHPQ